MTTPLEDSLLDEFLSDLRTQAVSEEIIDSLKDAFTAEKLPSAEVLAETFRNESGDKLA